MKHTLIIFGLFLGFAQQGFAQQTPRADLREKTQTMRIVDGVNQGELTPRETRQLARQQRKIRRMERRAKADGTVSSAERARIQQAQNRANRNIRRKKHNAQN